MENIAAHTVGNAFADVRLMFFIGQGGTTAEQIEQAVQQGDRTFDDVKARLGVGKQCIKCKDLISLLIESYVEDLEEE